MTNGQTMLLLQECSYPKVLHWSNFIGTNQNLLSGRPFHGKWQSLIGQPIHQLRLMLDSGTRLRHKQQIAIANMATRPFRQSVQDEARLLKHAGLSFRKPPFERLALEKLTLLISENLLDMHSNLSRLGVCSHWFVHLGAAIINSISMHLIYGIRIS